MNKLVLENVKYISIHTKDVLKIHCGSICNDSLFDELEALCKQHVQQKIEKYENALAESAKQSVKADSLIEKIEHYMTYSLMKNNHKMRLTRKEYDYGMNRLDEAEKHKVEKWLDNNGGFEKYIFSGY
jgi:hypothetical protein